MPSIVAARAKRLNPKDHMGYRFLEDVSIADVAFEASGKNPEGLFEAAALALTNTMVRDLGLVEQVTEKRIALEADSLEMLLFDFLQELVFYKDAERLLFSAYKIDIKKAKKYELKAIAYGEQLNMAKHELLVDVKAVTMHLFEVKKVRAGWRARVVLDV